MIITHDKVTEPTHRLPTEWLGKRVAGWMEDESNGACWWVCALTREGDWKYSSNDGHCPDMELQDYARQVCKHLNKVAHHGGAWLSGWFDSGRRFYLLWKDEDGDIQIPIECDKGWENIQNWKVEHWAEHAEQAHAMYVDFHKCMQISKGQKVKLAQGEAPKIS